MNKTKTNVIQSKPSLAKLQLQRKSLLILIQILIHLSISHSYFFIHLFNYSSKPV